MDDEHKEHLMTHEKKKLSPGTQAAFGVVGLVQVVFALLAFWDLAHRSAAQLRGPRAVWIPAILVNWIGPASYFLFGIRR